MIWVYSEFHVGIETQKASKCPDGEHVPVAGVCDGTSLVEDSLDALLCTCVGEGRGGEERGGEGRGGEGRGGEERRGEERGGEGRGGEERRGEGRGDEVHIQYMHKKLSIT